MEETKLEAEYQKILDEHQEELQSVARSDAANKRIHPRFKVETSDLWINSVPQFDLLDMSISGMAIRSNYPLEPGETIEVALGMSFRATAVVLDCKMVGSPDEYTDAEFRINCRFAEDLLGKELLVKAMHPSA